MTQPPEYSRGSGSAGSRPGPELPRTFAHDSTPASASPPGGQGYGSQAGGHEYGSQPTQQYNPQQPQSAYGSQPDSLKHSSQPGGQAFGSQPGGQPAAATGHDSWSAAPSAQSGYGQSGHGQSGYGQNGPHSGAHTVGPTAQFPPLPPQPPAPQRSRRGKGPGWGGVVGVAAIAALIAGGLGGGIGYVAADGLGSSGSSGTTTSSQNSTSNRQVQTTEVPDWTSIAEQASKSVVAIQVSENGQVGELGSGFVYQPEGSQDLYILTNNHVVANGDSNGGEVTAVFKDGSTVRTEIVGRDPETDVAALRLVDQPSGLSALPIGDSDSLNAGEPVMALGNPLGLADTVTTGIVSALNRPVTTSNPGAGQEDVATITNAIQTDAAINPGNSGGPLVNGAGEVIGITSSAATLSQDSSSSGNSGSIGIGFAIPIYQATNIADQLIADGQAKHPFLGVEIATGQVENNGVSVSTAEVKSVEGNSPAEAGGIQAGDNILSVDGTPVSSGVSLQALVRSKRAGDTLTVKVVRGGSEQDISVTLAER